MTDIFASVATIGPELAVVGLALFVLCFDLVWKGKERLLSWLSVIVLGCIFVWTSAVARYGLYFYDTLVIDPVSIVFKQLFLVGTAVIVLISMAYLEQFSWRAEFLSLILMACSGMMLVSSANELVTLYVTLEMVSISFFILAAYKKEDMLSTEAGLKIYMQGFASSAVLLYGLSLLYGFTGSTYLPVIAGFVAKAGFASNPILILASVMVLAGFGFKLSLVPFHMWLPDVYQGAPTPIAAFLSIGSKTAGIIVFLRVIVVTLQSVHADMAVLFGALAILTMTLGNLIAIPQTNIKRLLGYSTIAQLGYMFLGVVLGNALGISGLLFYLITYTFANLLAFTVVIAVYNTTRSLDIGDYAGLVSRNPLLAVGLTIALLSLAGIPPLAGFVAKFYLFSSAVSEGYLFLVAVAVANSIISMAYYLRIIQQMFWGRTDRRHGPIRIGLPIRLALLITLVLVIAIGLYPAPFLVAVEYAVSFMF